MLPLHRWNIRAGSLPMNEHSDLLSLGFENLNGVQAGDYGGCDAERLPQHEGFSFLTMTTLCILHLQHMQRGDISVEPPGNLFLPVFIDNRGTCPDGDG